MGAVRPDTNSTHTPLAEGEPRSTAEPSRRFATVDPEEQRRWSRRLLDFCADKFTPSSTRS